MSLINQVLRDLDSRHADDEQKALPNEVRPLPRAETGRPGRTALVLVAVVAVIGAGAWAGWTYLSAPAIKPAAVPVPAPRAVVETPPPPLLVIAPPEPPSENLAAAAVEPATMLPPPEKPAAAETQVSTLQLATALRPPAATAAVAAPAAAPAPAASASIDKHIRNDAHERAEVAYRKAASERRQGRSAEAMAQLREALREEPGHGNARQLLLSLLVEQQQWPEAETLLRDGLALTPNGPWAMALARIQVERGQSDQAWETLRKYMAAGEANADYQGFAGVLLQRLQRPGEAVAHYEAALRLKPDARWWAGLGLALEAAGHAGEAREAFQQAQATGGLNPEMAAVVDRHLR